MNSTCPRCGSARISTERRPHGNSTCLNCHFTAPSTSTEWEPEPEVEDDESEELPKPGLSIVPSEERDEPHREYLAQVNVEKLEALAEVYGIDEVSVLNIAVSDLFDAKISANREAEGDD